MFLAVFQYIQLELFFICISFVFMIIINLYFVPIMLYLICHSQIVFQELIRLK